MTNESVETTSRREMLAFSARFLGAGWIAMNIPMLATLAACARQDAASGAGFTTFTEEEGRAFAAFAAQIFPTDDQPGANEAGVAHFADRALGSFLAGEAGFTPDSSLADSIRAGLRDLDERARAAGSQHFADVPFEKQTELVRQVDQTPFFGVSRAIVIMGMFSEPSHGGNTNGTGWALIEREHEPGYQPPFGYYDAEYSRSQSGGAE